MSRGYFRNVNLSNTRIANFNRVSSNFFSGKGGAQSAHFANMNKPGALNAMSQNGLQHGLSVHGNSVHLAPSDLKGAQSLSRLNVSPTRESMLGAKTSRRGAASSRCIFATDRKPYDPAGGVEVKPGGSGARSILRRAQWIADVTRFRVRGAWG